MFKRKRPNLYIIEDNDMFRLTIDMMISRQYEMNTYDFASYEACITANEQKPDIIILDHGLPGINGLDAIPRLKEKWPNAQIIVVSSLEDTKTALKIFKAGICDYIEKASYTTEELFTSINKAIVQLKIRVPLKKNSVQLLYTTIKTN